jgi:hypothetical protein
VGERHGALVLVYTREHFQKYLLGKVFLSDPARQVGAGDPYDEGMEVLDKLPRSDLIAFANAIETASQIKRLVVRHVRIDASSGMFCKTLIGRLRLPVGRSCSLTFRIGGKCIGAAMAPALQALRLTRAHDL